jgi:hypothetical protein
MGVGAEDEVGRVVGVAGDVIVGDFSTGGLVAVAESDETGIDGGGAEQAARRKTTMVKEEL